MLKKVLIAAGGSGGHLFPAQALAEQLKDEGYEILFVGPGLKNNPYFKNKEFESLNISCSPLSGKNPFRYLAGGIKILTGMIKSYLIIRKYQPHLVVGFGSYHTLPALLGAKLSRTPIILHEANVIPGRVNRYLSPYVAKTAVHFSASKKYLKGNVIVSGMPIRKSMRSKAVTKEKACKYFSLEKDRLTLLVFGGSQGALKLNKIVSKALIKHVSKQIQSFQILHFTGKDKFSEEISGMYKNAGIPHVVKPFEEHMEFALALADLVISRSGASSLAEQTHFASPMILIPYPYAMDNHQEKNADAFIEEAKGGIKILEKNLSPEKLGTLICELLNDPSKLAAMRKNIEHYRDSFSHQTLLEIIGGGVF